MLQADSTRYSLFCRENRFAIELTFFLTILFVSIVLISNGNIDAVALFPIVAIAILLLVNYELALMATIVMLFMDFGVSIYSSAVVFSLLLLISFLIKFKKVDWSQLSNPLNIPIMVYGLCVLPSLFNSVNPILSFLKLYNVGAFLIVMYIVMVKCQSYKSINKLVGVFLIMVFFNSIDVFRLVALGEKRPFGFSSYWFVDYSALGICLSIVSAIFLKGFQRIIFLVLSFVFAVALILTQTRSTWLSAMITLCIIASYVLLYPETIGLARKRVVVYIAVGLLLMIGSVSLALIFNPRIENRATELVVKPEYGIDQQGKAENSIITRMFIWNTAINAFRAHPFIGIGVYSFPFSSQYYYGFSKYFYKRYVDKLPTHQTHLAVLAETGILGFIGFLIFIGALLLHSFRTIRTAVDRQEKFYSLVAATCVIYCTISMFVTDAWMWGQQIVLLGFVIGSMLAVRQMCMTHKGL